jgi:hypothetical protein
MCLSHPPIAPRLRSLSLAFAKYATSFVMALVTIAPQHVHASPLDDLQDSNVMRSFENKDPAYVNKGRSGGKPLVGGIDPSSNLASLWLETSGPLLLLNWANIKVPFYDLTKTLPRAKDSGVEVQAQLSDKSQFKLAVTIRVPHPSIEPLVKAGILKEYTEFLLPSSEVEAQRSLSLDGATATFIHSVKGECSVTIPIAHHGVINVSTKSCERSEELIHVVEQFDIVRLNRKLNS